MRVVRLSNLATVLLEEKREFAGWVLDLIWMFWRKDSSLVRTKIWNLDISEYIRITALTATP